MSDPFVYPPKAGAFDTKLNDSNLEEEQVQEFVSLVQGDGFKTNVKNAFAKFDSDNSGFIEVNEIGEAVKGLLEGDTATLLGTDDFPADILSEFVREYDSNQDGKLDISEFWDLALCLALWRFELKHDAL
jgi:Ca2+-binding EF-hand superfamily protein